MAGHSDYLQPGNNQSGYLPSRNQSQFVPVRGIHSALKNTEFQTSTARFTPRNNDFPTTSAIPLPGLADRQLARTLPSLRPSVATSVIKKQLSDSHFNVATNVTSRKPVFVTDSGKPVLPKPPPIPPPKNTIPPIPKPPPPDSRPPPRPEFCKRSDSRNGSLDSASTHSTSSFPAHFDDADPTLHNFGWFHGAISREIAEELLCRLQHNGGFLVRYKQEKTNNFPYVLSVYCDKKVYHLHIRYIASKNCYALGEEKPNELNFEQLQKLITRYQKDALDLLRYDGTPAATIKLSVSPPKTR